MSKSASLKRVALRSGIQGVFIAAAIHARYAGRPDAPWLKPATGLLSPSALLHALILGRTMLLAYRFSGGVPALLATARLRLDADRVRLEVGSAAPAPDSDVSPSVSACSPAPWACDAAKSSLPTMRRERRLGQFQLRKKAPRHDGTLSHDRDRLYRLSECPAARPDRALRGFRVVGRGRGSVLSGKPSIRSSPRRSSFSRRTKPTKRARNSTSCAFRAGPGPPPP